MTSSRRAPLTALVGAECGKIWASRIPLAFLLALTVVSLLFVVDIYRVERVTERVPPVAAMEVLSVLLFATWKTLLFPAALIAFCAFWMTLDSQYGMIRVSCSLPLSRTEYLVGRWLAVSAYVVLFVFAFVFLQVAWVAACSGVAGVASSDLARIGRFSLELLALVLALALVTMAASSMRRTVGGGIVTAYIVFIGLAFMTMLPHHLVPPRLVLLRYFFFPLQEFADPYAAFGGRDSPFVRAFSLGDFFIAVLATPIAFVIPALLYFGRRDVTE